MLAATVRARSAELGLDFLGLRAAGRRAADVMASGGEVVLLLGNERSGLSNEEMLWANAAVAIPTHVPFPLPGASLNLSHAAGIIVYELFRARGGGEGGEGEGGEGLEEEVVEGGRIVVLILLVALTTPLIQCSSRSLTALL